MTNPIDNGTRIGRGPITDAGNKAGAGESRTDASAPARRDPGVGADQSLSSERLQAVREAIDNTPEVDTDRVESIREQLAGGDYPLDAERIASRFIEFEQLLSDGGR